MFEPPGHHSQNDPDQRRLGVQCTKLQRSRPQTVGCTGYHVTKVPDRDGWGYKVPCYKGPSHRRLGVQCTTLQRPQSQTVGYRGYHVTKVPVRDGMSAGYRSYRGSGQRQFYLHGITATKAEVRDVWIHRVPALQRSRPEKGGSSGYQSHKGSHRYIGTDQRRLDPRVPALQRSRSEKGGSSGYQRIHTHTKAEIRDAWIYRVHSR